MHSFEVSLGYESVDRSTFSMKYNVQTSYMNFILKLADGKHYTNIINMINILTVGFILSCKLLS